MSQAPIPVPVLGTLILIAIAYVGAAELTKYWFCDYRCGSVLPLR